MKELHWMQTPEGKAKMAKVQKKAWRKRKQREKLEAKTTRKYRKTGKYKKSSAERAIKHAIKNGLAGNSKPRHTVHLYTQNGNGLHKEKHTIRSWGEFIDLVQGQQSAIDEVYIECNVK